MIRTSRFMTAFWKRISTGDFLNAAYLSYYYLFLLLYDLKFNTDFANSQTPTEGGVPTGGTGNFPAHPRLVRKYINAANIQRDSRILDVGHGSGIVLHVAHKMGFTHISGIEYSKLAFDKSMKNLSKDVNLIHGDALDFDISPYDSLFFFSPFRGEMAKQFFSDLPSSLRTIITVNHDKIIELPLSKQGFSVIYSYRHPIYRNFNAKVWKRLV